jgi:hypothetical protein
MCDPEGQRSEDPKHRKAEYLGRRAFMVRFTVITEDGAQPQDPLKYQRIASHGS